MSNQPVYPSPEELANRDAYAKLQRDRCEKCIHYVDIHHHALDNGDDVAHCTKLDMELEYYGDCGATYEYREHILIVCDGTSHHRMLGLLNE